MDLKEIECKCVDLVIKLADDRVQQWALVNTVMNRVLQEVGNFFTS
jgi:hypothetical protein